MKKSDFQKEREKMLEIFKDVDPDKAKLVEGLIDEAAFIRVENMKLRGTLVETGMVKFHPVHKDIQRPVETARQYRQNVNSYAVLIKTLNGILQKSPGEEDDEFDKWLRERTGE